MIKFFLFTLILSLSTFSQDYNSPRYKEIAEKIYKYAHKDSTAWDRMAYLCDNYGHRISGSDDLEKAIGWIYQEMQKDGFENVKKEPVMVPTWLRGKGECIMTSPWEYTIPVLALGSSVSTPLKTHT